MRILYSHRTKSSDGQFVHIRALTEALADAGADVLICGPDGVFAPHELAELRLDAGKKGRKGLAAKLPQPIYESAEYAYSLPAFFRLWQITQKFKPDIIYERANLFYEAGTWLKKITGLPLLLEINAPLAQERAQHGGLSLSNLATAQEKNLWRSADYLLPVSTPLAQRAKEAGVADTKISVLSNGVTQSQLTPGNGNIIRTRYNLQNKIILGFTGFVRDWHGVDMVLNWMAKEANKNIGLLLVGDGPAVEGLKQQAANLNISDRFHVTGVVQRESLNDHIAAFDIALQPRVTDYASPLKLFDYMAQARAILAPHQANISEILTEDKDALLFTPNDSKSFDAALSKLCHDASLRARLGKEVRATLEARDYTWRGNARRVLAIAETLLSKK